MKFMIFWVNLDPTVGVEINKTRPCLVVSPDEMNNALKTVTVIPLTTKVRALPTRILIKACAVSGLQADSYAVVDQIKTIDKSRLAGFIGTVSDDEKIAVTDAILEMFRM